MALYEQGRAGGFESGIAAAVEGILASPQFVFRLESAPGSPTPARVRRVTDPDLASRLSFFLWGTGPDAELLDIAGRGLLSAPGAVEQQVGRMLADPRAAALATRFASQWLRLNDV